MTLETPSTPSAGVYQGVRELHCGAARWKCLLMRVHPTMMHCSGSKSSQIMFNCATTCIQHLQRPAGTLRAAS